MELDNGVELEERLTPADRRGAVTEIASLRRSFPKVDMPELLLDAYLDPPRSPRECIFSQATG